MSCYQTTGNYVKQPIVGSHKAHYWVGRPSKAYRNIVKSAPGLQRRKIQPSPPRVQNSGPCVSSVYRLNIDCVQEEYFTFIYLFESRFRLIQLKKFLLSPKFLFFWVETLKFYLFSSLHSSYHGIPFFQPWQDFNGTRPSCCPQVICASYCQ